MIGIIEKTGKPGMGGSVPHFGGTGFGADLQIGEIALAVCIDHIVPHHFRELIRGVAVNELRPQFGDIEIQREIAGALDRRNDLRYHHPTAVADGAHVNHHGAGVHEILGLPYPRPAQSGGVFLAESKGTLGRADAVDGIGFGQTQLIHIIFHGIGAQLQGEGGEGAVAGFAEGTFEIHLAVGGNTGDIVIADMGRTGAGIRPVFVIQIVDHRRRGDGFKDGARHKSGRKEAVDIVTVVFRRGFGNGIVRVVAGRADRADDLAGFVIIHTHTALPPVQGVIGCGADRSVDGQIKMPPLAAVGIGAVNEVIAGEFTGEFRFRAGGDISRHITDNMKGGAANGGIFRIDRAVFRILQKEGAVTVVNRAGIQRAVGKEVFIGRERSPVAAIGHKAETEQHQTEEKTPGQQQTDDGPPFKLPHRTRPLSLSSISVSRRSWHSAAYPRP